MLSVNHASLSHHANDAANLNEKESKADSLHPHQANDEANPNKMEASKEEVSSFLGSQVKDANGNEPKESSQEPHSAESPEKKSASKADLPPLPPMLSKWDGTETGRYMQRMQQRRDAGPQEGEPDWAHAFYSDPRLNRQQTKADGNEPKKSSPEHHSAKSSENHAASSAGSQKGELDRGYYTGSGFDRSQKSTKEKKKPHPEKVQKSSQEPSFRGII